MAKEFDELEKQRNDLELKRLETQELQQKRNIRAQALSHAQQNRKEGEDVLALAANYAKFLNAE